jgi:hypothetical protein
MKANFLLWIVVISTSLALTSCQKDDASDAIVYAEESIQELETRTLSGRGACFELVFPITIAFPDNTSAEADSYDQLKQIITDWRKNNPNATRKNRPQVVFPISVVTQDGETVVVDDEVELRQLRRDCKRVANGFGKACFRFNYPVSIAFPDGTTSSFDSPRKLREGLHRWKKANPNADTRPQMVFPLTVTLEDGSSLTLNSKEELIRLKESCK